MNRVRWNIAVPQDMDQSVRMFLGAQGGGRKGDLSRFIEEAVRAHLLNCAADQAKATVTASGVSETELTDLTVRSFPQPSRAAVLHGTVKKGLVRASALSAARRFRPASLAPFSAADSREAPCHLHTRASPAGQGSCPASRNPANNSALNGGLSKLIL
jgi:hypothetical protein